MMYAMSLPRWLQLGVATLGAAALMSTGLVALAVSSAPVAAADTVEVYYPSFPPTVDSFSGAPEAGTSPDDYYEDDGALNGPTGSSVPGVAGNCIYPYAATPADGVVYTHTTTSPRPQEYGTPGELEVFMWEMYLYATDSSAFGGAMLANVGGQIKNDFPDLGGGNDLSGYQVNANPINFANSYPGPWNINVSLGGGPFAEGDTYTGTVWITAANGATIPAGADGVPGLGGVSLAITSGSFSGEPNWTGSPGGFPGGVQTFNWVADGTSASVTATAFDIPDPTLNYYETGGGYQDLISPAAVEADASNTATVSPSDSPPSGLSAALTFSGPNVYDTIDVTGDKGTDYWIDWYLRGPVPAENGSCVGDSNLDSSAPLVGDGFAEESGDVDHQTITETVSSQPEPNVCYGYRVWLSSTKNGAVEAKLDEGYGTSGQTFQAMVPQISGQVSDATPAPGASVSDTFDAYDTLGQSGSISWSLAGPVQATPPPESSTSTSYTCPGISESSEYADAGVVSGQSNTFGFTGNGDHPTRDFTVPSTAPSGFSANSAGEIIVCWGYQSSITDPDGTSDPVYGASGNTIMVTYQQAGNPVSVPPPPPPPPPPPTTPPTTSPPMVVYPT